MALTDKQKVLAAWLALPKDMREPSTQKALAEKLDVDQMTLSRWKKMHNMKAYVDDVLLIELRDRLGELHRALIDHAIAGKHPKYMEMALQLAMEQFGKKEVDVRITKNETVTMTTDDLADKMFGIFKKNGMSGGVSKAQFRNAIKDQQPALN